jgi:BMFP domain-containing protein YqiC
MWGMVKSQVCTLRIITVGELTVHMREEFKNITPDMLLKTRGKLEYLLVYAEPCITRAELRENVPNY